MERNKRKIGTSIISIVLIILILLLVVLGFDLYSNYKNISNDYKKLKDELEVLNKSSEEFDKQYKQINDKITELNNVDSSTSSLKEEVFELAKQLETKITNKETKYKIAYLTFDDGPYYLTNEYLDVLKEKKVKATFFTIGFGKTSCYDNRSQNCQELYKKIVDGGHTIANHTYSHLIFNGLYSSTDSFITQVKKQEELIKEKTGVTTNILRFPGGSSTAGKLKNSIITELRNMNYGWVDWSAQDGDGGELSSTTQAWNTFKNSINQDIEVVLFHDYSNITLSILPKAIDYLEENNYILLPLFYDSIKINK